MHFGTHEEYKLTFGKILFRQLVSNWKHKKSENTAEATSLPLLTLTCLMGADGRRHI